jgi:4-hydroxymandelate oxidase
MPLLNVAEYEARAHDLLSLPVFDYYFGGAHDEITLRENCAAYARLRLHHRALRGVARTDTSLTVLGHKLRTPVLVPPLAFQRMAHPDGELATARATAAAGSILLLSTLSTTSVEDVVAATDGPVWFQVYVYRDRAVTASLVERAEAAGCSALVLTVTAPRLGRRERDVRNSFRLPDGMKAMNLTAGGLQELRDEIGTSSLASYFASLIDPGLTWRDVAWLRSLTRLPIVIKGVVRPDDAVQAVEAGAAAIIVSNHGGRQLDTSPATIDVLASVVAAVAGRAEILVDGGIRRGTDVLKALALGARAVLVGRPVLWGLAVDGQQGASAVLQILHEELDLAMALCGCASLAEITPDLVHGPPANAVG